MMKKMLALAMMLCVLLVCMAGTAMATVQVSYVERGWDEANKCITEKERSKDLESVTSVTSGMASWTDGWYVVKNDVTIDERITISGDVHLILEDGKTLTANKGITLIDTNSLTIYGQEYDTGKLVAKGDTEAAYAAGIGGRLGNIQHYSGTLTIHGGTIQASGNQGAGIGGYGARRDNWDTYMGSAGCTLTIYGGNVTATSERGAGIGGGAYEGGAGGGKAGTIHIYGGVVKAKGNEYDIGHGAKKVGEKGEDSINFHGGLIFANDKVHSNTLIHTGGILFEGKQGKIANGTTKLEDNLTIEKDYTLTIDNNKKLIVSDGATLTIQGSIVNNGEIKLEGSGTVDCSGAQGHPIKSVTADQEEGKLSVSCFCGKDPEVYTLNVLEDFVYDGAAHPATVDGPAEDARRISATVKLTSSSDYKSAGEHTVQLYVEGAYSDKKVEKKFTISKADPVVTPPTAYELTYTGSAQTLVTAGTASGGTLVYSLDGVTYAKTLPTGTDADDYTVSYKVIGDRNHNDIAAQTIIVTIAKAEPALTAPTANTLTYTGSAHTLITAGSTADGEMRYSLDGENWSDALPTATDAGEYTVYYKVIGDSNHLDSEAASVTVTIAQSATSMTAELLDNKSEYTYGETVNIAVTPEATGAAPLSLRRFTAPAKGQVALYNGSEQITEPKAAGHGERVTFTLDTVADGLTPGSHTLTARYTASGNMDAQETDITFSVAFAEDAPENDADVSGDRNEAGWHRADPMLTAPEGSKISLGCGPEATWSDSLTLPTEDGEHPYTYYVKDESGLISEKTVTVMVDKSAPVVGEIDIQVGTNGAEITAPATDEHSGILDCRLTVNSGKGELEISGNGDGSYTITGMIPGETYDFTLTVMDRVGHTTTVSFTVTAAQLPQTGDESQLGLWLMLMGMACAGMLTLRRKAHN